jgi:hypothetical protein
MMPSPKAQGENGNLSYFRSIPRSVRDKFDERKSIAPAVTKYSPYYSVVHVDPKKNYRFGDKGEAETIRGMNERREKGDPGHVCSKGVTKCFKSVKRVK